jgi:hypothetical protein
MPCREGMGTVMPGPGRLLRRGGQQEQEERRQRVARRRRRLALEHQQVLGLRRRPELPRGESEARGYRYGRLIGGRCDAAGDVSRA